MSSAPQAILDLVERFRHNLDYYHRPDYNETQVRIEFIDPFFEALGWDVANRAGRSPRYQHVVHEATVRVGTQLRSPDYCFQIGGNPLFFVEAKKPSVDIRRDASPAYQLRIYAWNAKLPLSILTDFDEFSVYEGRRVRPAPKDDPATARVLCLTYEEYPERWHEIASVFSLEAVERGDYMRFAEANESKRGTQEVDEALVQQLESWRVLLARNLALRNPGLSARDLNYAVQKILDRIIFLRICEDRQIEPYEQLRNVLSSADHYVHLRELFRRADARYNSGLFHFRHERGRGEAPDTLTPTLALDNRVLREIIGQLYYPESPYAFDAISPDILGNVYERFLGSVIRLTQGHRAVVEQKPEVRKAGGVYYTPKYIVDYIVAHTVGELVKDKTPGQIADVRILDPACGSGSFLLGAYQYLLDWYRDWYAAHPTRLARKELYQAENGEWRLTIAEKKRILLTHLYGVDIDPQAVEVTKLSLLLAALRGETAGTLQLELLPERALPDLANNIKCGNSLIGPDFYDGQQTAMFDEEEWYRVNAFDWQARFPEVFEARGQGSGDRGRGSAEPRSLTPDPSSRGFDAVIGNPPYVRIQTMKEWAPKEVEFYKGRYVAASKGNYDIYVVFVERGLSLLNAKGRLGFILPHKFFNAQYGAPLRGLLAQGAHLAEVVHFGDQQVFAGATTYTCLMFLNKAGSEGCTVQKVSDLPAWLSERQAVAGKVPAGRITEAEWNFVVGRGASVFWKLADMPTCLGDVCDRIFQGLVTGADPVFILQNRGEGAYYSEATDCQHIMETDLMHPLCKGSINLRRYQVEGITRDILFPYQLGGDGACLLGTKELSRAYPSIWAYLLLNRARLESREHGKWKHERWYAFGRSQNLDQMEQTKLMTPSIAKRASFTLDSGEHYYFVGSGGGGGGGYGITLRADTQISYEYLLGLLNSRLLDHCLQQLSTPFRGGYYAYNRQYIEQLPIRTIDFSSSADVAWHDRMVALVERMLALHKELAAARTPTHKTMLQRQIEATDQQIDALVYELYDLTEEEIKIVEGR